MWFWVLAGLAVALTRIVREARPAPVAPGD
jgi:hypothetical protein